MILFICSWEPRKRETCQLKKPFNEWVAKEKKRKTKFYMMMGQWFDLHAFQRFNDQTCSRFCPVNKPLMSSSSFWSSRRASSFFRGAKASKAIPPILLEARLSILRPSAPRKAPPVKFVSLFVSQVWPLTQSYGVSFSQSRISLQKCFLITQWVICFNGVMGPPHLAQQAWRDSLSLQF